MPQPSRLKPGKEHVILFLAANPRDTGRVALDAEARAIHVELKRSGFRDRFKFETRWAVEPLDFLRHVRELKPTIVHFSGHGVPSSATATQPQHRDVGAMAVPASEPGGLVVHGANGHSQIVTPEALSRTLDAAGASVRLVVLNGCYTAPIAEALLAHVDCVVGMTGAIHDAAARSFAIGFYGGLAEHESVASAFKQGNAAIDLDGLPGADQPQLNVRDGFDATQLILAAVEPSTLVAVSGMRPFTADDASRFHGPIVQTGNAAGRDINLTVQVGSSPDDVAERVVALLAERKVLSQAPPEFTEEDKELARRAKRSADAVVQANAQIVLGRYDDARAALQPASHITDEAVRYFTAMGDSFYFEQRFDEALPWYERAFQMPGRDRDVKVRTNLALALEQCRLGEIGAQLRRAIRLSVETLALVSPTSQAWAGTQNNLGNAWRELPTGDRGDNVRQAIACYEAALTVYTRDANPVAWAGTQSNLGNAWSELPTGDRGENVSRAIECYEHALTVYMRESHPVAWAMTEHNMGTAWSELPTGDRGENVSRAIACFDAALIVRTRDAHPVDWAMTQNNLGTAWVDLPIGDRGDNVRQAIACYEAALTVYTRDAHPVAWAATQNNLGNAWYNLPTGDRGDNVRQAIACYEAALTVYTRDAHPVAWAMTQSNLATATKN